MKQVLHQRRYSAVSRNHHQRIVQIVRQTAGDLLQSVRSLGRQRLLLQLLSRGDICKHAGDRFAAGANRFPAPDHIAGGRDGPEFGAGGAAALDCRFVKSNRRRPVFRMDPVAKKLPRLQPVGRGMAKHFGGSSVDIPFAIKFTPDGGTIVVGYTDSKDGDVSPQPNRDYWDLWVLKLDRCGIPQWEKSMGGTGYESARDVAITPDGGYLVLGETNSTDGDVVAGYGGTKDILP